MRNQCFQEKKQFLQRDVLRGRQNDTKVLRNKTKPQTVGVRALTGNLGRVAYLFQKGNQWSHDILRHHVITNLTATSVTEISTQEV